MEAPQTFKEALRNLKEILECAAKAARKFKEAPQSALEITGSAVEL